jgi:hypothetical protein
VRRERAGRWRSCPGSPVRFSLTSRSMRIEFMAVIWVTVGAALLSGDVSGRSPLWGNLARPPRPYLGCSLRTRMAVVLYRTGRSIPDFS